MSQSSTSVPPCTMYVLETSVWSRIKHIIYKSGDCSFCSETGKVVRLMDALVFGVCHIPNNTPPSLHFIVVLSIKE